MARLLPFAVLAAVLLAGCLVPGSDSDREIRFDRSEGSWVLSTCGFTSPGGATLTWPDLLVVLQESEEKGAPSGPRVHRHHFAAGSWHLAASSRVEVSFAPYPGNDVAVEVLGDRVFAYAHLDGLPVVVALDRDLAVIANAETGSFGALATHGGRLLVAGDHLAIHDVDLRLLGHVELPLKEGGYSGKVAHDAFARGGVAYLLDNVVTPLFVLRVDVRDDARPRVIDKFEIQGVSARLPGHWLDADAGYWMVLQAYGGRGHAGMTLHAYPLEDDRDETVLGVQRVSHNFESDDWNEAGFTIVATTEDAPAWAFIRDSAGYRFGRLDVDVADSRMRFCEHRLPFALATSVGEPAVGVHREGNLVVGHFDGHVFLIDESASSPALVHAQDLGGSVLAARLMGG